MQGKTSCFAQLRQSLVWPVAPVMFYSKAVAQCDGWCWKLRSVKCTEAFTHAKNTNVGPTRTVCTDILWFTTTLWEKRLALNELRRLRRHCGNIAAQQRFAHKPAWLSPHWPGIIIKDTFTCVKETIFAWRLPRHRHDSSATSLRQLPGDLDSASHLPAEIRCLCQRDRPFSTHWVWPDILIAVDVDPMELMLEVLVLHVGHVVNHFQNHEAR